MGILGVFEPPRGSPGRLPGEGFTSTPRAGALSPAGGLSRQGRGNPRRGCRGYPLGSSRRRARRTRARQALRPGLVQLISRTPSGARSSSPPTRNSRPLAPRDARSQALYTITHPVQLLLRACGPLAPDTPSGRRALIQRGVPGPILDPPASGPGTGTGPRREGLM